MNSLHQNRRDKYPIFEAIQKGHEPCIESILAHYPRMIYAKVIICLYYSPSFWMGTPLTGINSLRCTAWVSSGEDICAGMKTILFLLSNKINQSISDDAQIRVG